jgi:hypothetical protein
MPDDDPLNSIELPWVMLASAGVILHDATGFAAFALDADSMPITEMDITFFRNCFRRPVNMSSSSSC